MKKVSVCIPCYNEEQNIAHIYEAISKIFSELEDYNYEIIFADNASNDNSEAILRELANRDKRVKVIFNTRNFGPMRSQKNCTYHASGEAIITLTCDFQDPPELIPEFLKEWEKGNKIVWGQKIESQESKFKYFLRNIYYKIINFFSEEDQLKQVTGFGLIDREVLEYLKYMDEPLVPIRNLVSELGYNVTLIPYTQPKRKYGKSSYNVSRYLNFAIHSFIYTSKNPLRIVTVSGLIMAVICLLVGFVYMIYKFLHWNSFQVGIAPMLIGVFFLGAIQIFLLGILGEYIGIILEKVQKRPLVVEKEIINFEENM